MNYVNALWELFVRNIPPMKVFDLDEWAAAENLLAELRFVSVKGDYGKYVTSLKSLPWLLSKMDNTEVELTAEVDGVNHFIGEMVIKDEKAIATSGIIPMLFQTADEKMVGDYFNYVWANRNEDYGDRLRRFLEAA